VSYPVSSGLSITLVAQSIIAAGALWLAVAGLVAVISPEAARRFIARMGSTPRIHFTEHFLRGVVGVALILGAASSKFPVGFYWAGIFIAATSLLILIAPREWHARYSRSAARKLSDGKLRALGPISLAAGIALLWAVKT
jgi:uncharacterized protein YjeT (DUF2065 family)